MKVKNKEISFEEALEIANTDELLLKRRKNGFLINDFQIGVLKNNGIEYQQYASISELLFDIMEVLNENYDDELDLVSSQIAELIYYKDTKK